MVSISPYPLRQVSEVEFSSVCQILWGWQVCGNCSVGQGCQSSTCITKRLARLTAFYAYYKRITGAYLPDLLPNTEPALRNHRDLAAVIQIIKSKSHLPRSQIVTDFFQDAPGTDSYQLLPSATDQSRAFDLAVKVMVMVTCSVETESQSLVELGNRLLPWRDHTSFTQFLSEVFPTANNPRLNDNDREAKDVSIKAALNGQNIVKTARLKLQPTDNLRNHLKLDVQKGTVDVYHFTSVMKEHLSAPDPVNALPRQIAKEVLHSIQHILFPATEQSYKLLQDLVSNSSFDPDCLHYESVDYPKENSHEEKVTYHYFGSRLLDIYEELQDPRPRGGIEKWFERRSSARYVMMATFIGVIFAVILGILGLIVAIFQAWVAYQQWKHPINT
jgi:hypothetical protein